MTKKIYLILFSVLLFSACQQKPQKKAEEIKLSETVINEAVKQINQKYSIHDPSLVVKGVKHAASLWRSTDGTPEDFIKFCTEQFIADPVQKEATFNHLAEYFESLKGHFRKLGLDLQQNVVVKRGPILPIDPLFAAFSPEAHMANDLYENKIAFIIALNFPYYTTEEKIELGKNWSSLEWGYARMGDEFTSRIPSELLQKEAKISAEAEAYVADYNIYMGSLLGEKKEKLFPENMILLTHWNLRDEIKSGYANKENGFEKQKTIYKVMERIVDQSIPKQVINSGKYNWNPFTNELLEGNNVPVASQAETDSRYQHILDYFHIYQEYDKYNPILNTAIQRSFSASKQIPQPEVEQIFDQFLSSPQVKQVGELIKKRLGRELAPWDIWYDGFKARSSINEETLNAITQKKYPHAKAFEDDMPNILQKFGFSKEKAAFISSKVTVDPARGSGHAAGASMKSEKAHLRTRVPETGMNYKGYNIAVHEFGHNVEQTISLHDVPNYLLEGVPNTAFTEALAFVFQQRDLFLLNMKDENPQKDYLKTLDIFWSVYEIMGVSMVDMKTWQWLYAHPACTAIELRDAVVQISKDVWNKYYAPVFGINDQIILGIYSHMINYPMYLPNYAFGDLIHFQLEEHFKTHNFASEIERMYALGQLTPNEWMIKAVGSPLSNEAILKAVEEAVEKLK